jgi:4-hydroxy-tetrahydrodipicolinate synthase
MNICEIRKNSLITAIKTPFDSQGRIDLASFDFLVEQQIKHGVDGLIIGGTTGEGHLLDWEEHLMLIAHASNRYADRLLIVGNTGSNNTREAIKATQYGFASGMHASLQINPYYGKTSLTGVHHHLQAGLDLGPAFIYNVPSRTGQDIPPSVIKQLASHENFIGVKECAGNQRIENYETLGIACWSGNDDEAFDARHQCNSHGVISVASNIIPGIMKNLMDSNQNNDLNELVQPLIKWLFEQPNPIAINTALAMTKAIKPVFRLPYCPLAVGSRKVGKAILAKLDPSQIVGGSVEALLDSDFELVI